MNSNLTGKKYFWHKSIINTLNGSKFSMKCFKKKKAPFRGPLKLLLEKVL
jgi:hypothetical protein